MNRPLLSRGEHFLYVVAATLFASAFFITVYDFAVAS